MRALRPDALPRGRGASWDLGPPVPAREPVRVRGAWGGPRQSRACTPCAGGACSPRAICNTGSAGAWDLVASSGLIPWGCKRHPSLPDGVTPGEPGAWRRGVDSLSQVSLRISAGHPSCPVDLRAEGGALGLGEGLPRVEDCALLRDPKGGDIPRGRGRSPWARRRFWGGERAQLAMSRGDPSPQAGRVGAGTGSPGRRGPFTFRLPGGLGAPEGGTSRLRSAGGKVAGPPLPRRFSGGTAAARSPDTA